MAKWEENLMYVCWRGTTTVSYTHLDVYKRQVKKNTIIYVNDCLCYSNNIQTHLNHLETLLNNLNKANITVNLTKSQFFRREISFLGYRLTTKGIQATDDKVKAIMDFPAPKNTKQLKGFLGLTNFYNRFTSKYAETTQPLHELLKGGRKFSWTREVNECFQRVKNLFINTVTLRFPRPNQRYYICLLYTSRCV